MAPRPIEPGREVEPVRVLRAARVRLEAAERPVPVEALRGQEAPQDLDRVEDGGGRGLDRDPVARAQDLEVERGEERERRRSSSTDGRPPAPATGSSRRLFAWWMVLVASQSSRSWMLSRSRRSSSVSRGCRSGASPPAHLTPVGGIIAAPGRRRDQEAAASAASRGPFEAPAPERGAPARMLETAEIAGSSRSKERYACPMLGARPADRHPPGSHELRRPRLQPVRPRRLRPRDGADGRGPLAPRHRSGPDVERVQSLPPPPARGGRGREARRVAGGRPAPRVPDHLAGRDLPVADQHAVPEPHGDGHRGDDPRPADGRSGAAGRLRQDPAGPAHGRRRARTGRRSSSRRAPCSPAATRECGWARARTAAGSGPSTARARSTRSAWRRSRASSSPPPAPAWSWAPPARWPR